MPPVFPRSQSPPPPTVWDRFAPAVRARRPPCHVPGAMRSGRERRLRPWGCAFQTSLASATSWAVASIAALRPEPTEGGGQGRGNFAQPSESSVPGTGRSFPEGKLWELFLLRGVQQMEGLAVNELIQVNDLIPPPATLVAPPPTALLISTTLNCAYTVRCCARVSVWRSGLTECCQEMLCGAVRTGLLR